MIDRNFCQTTSRK